MENELFVNPEMESSFPTSIWSPELNLSSPGNHRFYNSINWENKAIDHLAHFDTSQAQNYELSGHGSVIREFIGKLGNIRNTSGKILSSTVAPPAISYMNGMNYNGMEFNMVSSNPTLDEILSDPGFAERAAKFSCFGSRNFNGMSQLGLKSNGAFQSCNSSIHRASNSLSLKKIGIFDTGVFGNDVNFLPPVAKMGKLYGCSSPMGHDQFGNNSQESSVSDQIPSREIGLNPRKRKACSRKKPNEISTSPQATKAPKVTGGVKNGGMKSENAPKDYIHVRARRGQATDNHSLAERVRREKISERMKVLQDLVPGCSKVTGKAPMLDEIINYVQSLQQQVKFLSMKLSDADIKSHVGNLESSLQKDMFQTTAALTHPIHAQHMLHSYGQHQNPQLLINNINIPSTNQCLVDQLVLPSLCTFMDEAIPQFDNLVSGFSNLPG